MYKNPLNNGDLSDYNLLKKVKDKSGEIKKYKRKLEQGVPTEQQKYYQYMTYQQPILDELIYIAERMRTEDINKQKEDFEFNEKLKEDREKKLKQFAEKNREEGARELFEILPKDEIDITPTISTNLEDQLYIDLTTNDSLLLQNARNDLFGEINQPLFLEDRTEEARIKDIFEEEEEFVKNLLKQTEKKDLPYKKEIQRRIREIDPKASISGNKDKLMEKLQQLEKERKTPTPQVEPKTTSELLAETEKKKAKKQKKKSKK